MTDDPAKADQPAGLYGQLCGTLDYNLVLAILERMPEHVLRARNIDRRTLMMRFIRDTIQAEDH